MKKYCLLIVILVSLFIITSGCGANADYDAKLRSLEERVAALESISHNNTIDAVPVDALIGVWENDKYIYTFNSDETGFIKAVTVDGLITHFVYAIEGKNTLKVIVGKSSWEDHQVEWRYTIDGDTLTITGNGQIISLTKHK